MTRVVMGLLFNDNGNILIAKRNETQRYGGHWEFPGGKIEPDETIENALEREIREELNAPIIISEIHPGYIFEHQKLKAWFIPVTGTIIEADITLMEHDDFKFISLGEFEAFDFSPYDQGAIQLLRRRQQLQLPGNELRTTPDW